MPLIFLPLREFRYYLDTRSRDEKLAQKSFISATGLVNVLYLLQNVKN